MCLYIDKEMDKVKWFTPTYYASGISDIDVNNLKAQGIKVIMLISITPRSNKQKNTYSSVVGWIENARAQACM